MNLLAAAQQLLDLGFSGFDPLPRTYIGRAFRTVGGAPDPNVTPDARFVIITPMPARRIRETYRGTADQRAAGVRLTIACTMPSGETGALADEADWLARRCEDILDGAQPALPGASRLRHQHTEWMGEDENLVVPSAYLVADFTCTIPI